MSPNLALPVLQAKKEYRSPRSPDGHDLESPPTHFSTGRDKANTVGLKVTALTPCAFVKKDAHTDVNKQHDD